MKKTSLTGIRPTGNLHLGNYLGTIREGLKLQEKFHCFYFVADMHGLTTNKDAETLKAYTYDVTAAWLAFGLDSSKHLLYRQSDLPMVTEYAWYLSCCTGMGLLQKAHSYKDAIAGGRDVNHGVFAYPVLMAADILMYDADVVPVGKDQKQHVEMARDMAGSVNAIYGDDVIKPPEPLINENVMVIPGLDGRKMSKSYGNEIPLFCDDKTLKKKVMSITTDSTPLEDPKKLDGSLLGELYRLFASDGQYKDLESRLAQGGLGWGHAKQELYELIQEHLADARAKFFELRPDTDSLDRILKHGAEQAFAVSEPVLNRLRSAMGYGKFGFKPC